MKQTFTLRLKPKLLKDIKIQAIREGKHVNEIIEVLLEDYLREVRWENGENTK